MDRVRGIQFISPILIPLVRQCECCKLQALLEFVVSYTNGHSVAVCLTCKNQLVDAAGVEDTGERVVVFHAG